METMTLYRAVSEVEFQQLMRTGKFAVVPSSLEGKFFAESAEDAAQWGEMLEGARHYRIVEVDLPTSVAQRADPAKFEAESATSATHTWVAPDGP